MKIIDKRNNRGIVVKSKNKFLLRNRTYVRKELNNIIKKTGILDIFTGDHIIKIKKKWLHEPRFKYDWSNLTHDMYLVGNNRYEVGDEVHIPISLGSKGDSDSEGDEGDGEGALPDSEDVFEFTMTSDEFRKMFFEMLELPNMMEKPGQCTKMVRTRSGYNKKGTPSKLDLKKTFELSKARRIASKSGKAPFLDELDIRYKYYKRKPTPWSKAVVYCIMDVSGSMDSDRRLLAKKFYMLLLLFLDSKYDHTEVVFIRHSDRAEMCNEKQFFDSSADGYTMASSAFTIVQQSILEDYKPADWNIYIAQVGDGGNDWVDNDTCKVMLDNDLSLYTQYILYMQVAEDSSGYYSMFKNLTARHSNMACGSASRDTEIFPVFYDFFKKGK